MLDRDRQRFQLHALLREELRNLMPPEVLPAVRHLWEKRESSRAASLTRVSVATAWRIGELEIAFRIVQQQEALCLELGNKDGLSRSYGNQAVILKDWGRPEEALALHKKEEALCLELGNRNNLAHCYWALGLLAHQQRDSKMKREKLAAALDIFTELNMPREREAVRAHLKLLSSSP
jgi:hypothetical protein